MSSPGAWIPLPLRGRVGVWALGTSASWVVTPGDQHIPHALPPTPSRGEGEPAIGYTALPTASLPTAYCLLPTPQGTPPTISIAP